MLHFKRVSYLSLERFSHVSYAFLRRFIRVTYQFLTCDSDSTDGWQRRSLPLADDTVSLKFEARLQETFPTDVNFVALDDIVIRSSCGLFTTTAMDESTPLSDSPQRAQQQSPPPAAVPETTCLPGTHDGGQQRFFNKQPRNSSAVCHCHTTAFTLECPSYTNFFIFASR